jgi:hypothetical protein
MRFGARWAVLTTVSIRPCTCGSRWRARLAVRVARYRVVVRSGRRGGPKWVHRSRAPRAGSLTERFGVMPDDLRGHLQVLAVAAAGSAANIAEVIASETASAVLGLSFAMLAMHYGLRHGERLSRRIADVLPLRPAYARSLLTEFRRVGRATLPGVFAKAFRDFREALQDFPSPRKVACERGDSNPHAVKHRNLNPACLPVPPRSQRQTYSTRGGQAISSTPSMRTAAGPW